MCDSPGGFDRRARGLSGGPVFFLEMPVRIRTDKI